MGLKELELIRAVWSLDADDDAWMAGIHGATNALFSQWGADGGTVLWKYGFNDHGGVEFSSMTPESPDVAAIDRGLLEVLAGNPEQEAMTRFYRAGPAFGTTDQQLMQEPPEAREYILAAGAPYGFRDSYGFVSGDRLGGVTAVSVTSTVLNVSQRQRDVGLGITSHVAAAYRLRERLADSQITPDTAGAILTADGTLLHQGNANANTARGQLREAAVQQIAAADGKRKTTEGVHEAWRALVEGRWTLVDYHEARGRRLLLVYENPNHFANPRALTKSELDVVALAARSHNNKQIATALGTSASTVSTHLASALGKLGLKRTELIRCLEWELEAPTDHGLVADELRLVSSESRRPTVAQLTPAESEVARLAALGMANDEIAKNRGTSPHTVANQLNSIYEKLGIESRNQLAKLV